MKTRWYDRRVKHDDRRQDDRREKAKIASMEKLVEQCTVAEGKLLAYVDRILRENGINLDA